MTLNIGFSQSLLLKGVGERFSGHNAEKHILEQLLKRGEPVSDLIIFFLGNH